MIIGYARISTGDQTHDLQIDALKAAGCERIWTETASGAKTDRPELADLLDHLRPGDTLVVWKLDRLGRSIQHLVGLIADLCDREVGFRSVTESIDTTTAGGRLVCHVFAALAEFERELIRERTMAGLNAARARGKVGGRRPSLTPAQVRTAQKLYDAETMTVGEIAEHLGVSRSTINRHVTLSRQSASGTEEGSGPATCTCRHSGDMRVLDRECPTHGDEAESRRVGRAGR